MSILRSVVNYDLTSTDNEVDHIYMDINMINSNSNSQPLQINMTESRSLPYIKNPSEYYLSIIRFFITTTTTLPVMIPQVQIGDDPNKLVHSFTLKFGANVYQKYATFIPQDLSVPTASAPTTSQNVSGGYYNLYNFSWFVKILNQCLTDAFNGLDALAVLPTTHAPQLLYDASTNGLIFSCDALGYDSALGAGSYIEIYMNNPTANMLSGFTKIKYADNNPQGMNYKLIVENDGSNLLELDTYNALQMLEEFHSTGAWNSIKSIVFTSNLPVGETLTSQPIIYGASSSLSVSSNNNVLPIISDFQIDLNTGLEIYPSVSYSPSGEYRLFDLFGHNSLSQIQISAWYSDIYNNLYPLKLSNGGTCNMKLLFRRKTFNK